MPGLRAGVLRIKPACDRNEGFAIDGWLHRLWRRPNLRWGGIISKYEAALLTKPSPQRKILYYFNAFGCEIRAFAASTEPPMNVAVKPSKLIKGSTGDWEVVIGMEVHAQVTSNSKLFSGASTEFGGEPNSQVSLVDAAMPGMLPVINAECVRQAVRTGLGLNAKINLRSVFDRKNYFYPDLPQGYQISQYKSPIVGEGEVVVELSGGETATIGIERLHLEQDAGKLLHDRSPTLSYVDLNRAGVALMEIVSKPDIRSSEQAKAYVTKIRSILRYLGTCDGDMEKGSLRADVNVSVRKPGGALGTRCEIKNMNSIAFIGEAIEYEARRQIEILEDGGVIDQEARLFDPNKGETRSMRSKEEAHDYRYFPDPDLLPLEFTDAYVAELKANLPELPDRKKARFIADFSLSPYDAGVLVAERESADFFEAVLAGLADQASSGKLAANWVINELFGRLNKEGRDIASSPVSAIQLGAIVDLIGEGIISGKIAKDLFEIVWQEGGDPRALVEARGMKQVTDLGAIEKVVDDIVAANPDKVAQARAKPQLIGWFVGQVMKSSGGKANPQAVNDLLKSKLGI
jgi:aspartyl-tRNA(Asn)/glutamyl-tRNA(Gln) amidotransferase subunit B